MNETTNQPTHGAVITTKVSVNEAYAYWRDLKHMPLFMKEIQSVEVIDAKTSRWTAKLPKGKPVQWTSRIIEEQTNRKIAWESVEGSDVKTRGAVLFHPASGGRGTVVELDLEFNPPGGLIGEVVAKLTGGMAEMGALINLHRFKSAIETGEVPTTEGQSSGRDETEESETLNISQKRASR